MADEILTFSLQCPHCGSNLEISRELDTFACAYCGTQQRVERKGGTVSLKLIGDAMEKVQSTLEITNAELAIRRLRGQLSDIENERDQLRQNQQPNPLTEFSTNLAVMSTVLGGLAAFGGFYFGEKVFLVFGIPVGLIGIAISRAIESDKTVSLREKDEFEMRLNTRLAEVQAEINKQLALINEAERA